MRKTILITLVLSLIFSLLSGCSESNFEYEDNGDDTCTITGYTGKGSGDLIIPKEINGLTVTIIGQCSFVDEFVKKGTSVARDTSGFTGSLILPDSIKEIKEFAFVGCDFTGGVVMPKSVWIIEEYAFNSCNGLTQVEFLDDAPYLGMAAFDNCADDFKIIYDPAKSGWSTPEWNGYPCYPKDS